MVFSGICPVVELPDHMIVLFLVFKGIFIPFSIVTVSVYIPTNSTRGFPFLQALQHLIFVDLSDDGHSDRGVVIPQCCFDLH